DALPIFIVNHHRFLVHERAGDEQLLLLPARKSGAEISRAFVKQVLLVLDECVQLQKVDELPDRADVARLARVDHVLVNAPIEQLHMLEVLAMSGTACKLLGLFRTAPLFRFWGPADSLTQVELPAPFFPSV